MDTDLRLSWQKKPRSYRFDILQAVRRGIRLNTRYLEVVMEASGSQTTTRDDIKSSVTN